ncbi:rust resistance kinase Lr10-like [Cryptomeria japonica]|uniref:rust resistance kinase Lr10-like n=1 Tax=Cryptomeria japonica TaxID=3369 RepID=UPI0027DA8764|nr:rust resistance kinase Lr10-like [Cryptomeria japonica]
MEFWSSPQFRISGECMNISIWGECREEIIAYLPTETYALECNKSWYHSDFSLGTYCKSLVQLPVKMFDRDSFRVKWNFSEGCEHCKPWKKDCISDNRNLRNRVKKMFFFDKEVPGRKRDNQRSISKETFLNSYVDEMQTRYSYSSLQKITNNFAHKLGEGGFGIVYKGKLPSGTLVAVKMLDHSRQSETQFMNEVATIGRIHHFHLVHLLGYCFEGVTSALVYKYMANGSLDKIALGAARGLAYLHNECHKRIIHFDIKPHNILLDEEFTAKVADFGLAKLCGRRDDHVSVTAARGTPGYVAPEVWSRNLGPVTDKSDVYSFGMMLLEMVGGRNNVDVQVSRSSQFYFPEWAFKLIENGKLRTRLRERISGADEVKARSLAKVGLWCIQYNSGCDCHSASM